MGDYIGDYYRGYEGGYWECRLQFISSGYNLQPTGPDTSKNKARPGKILGHN